MLGQLSSIGAPRALGVCLDGGLAHACLVKSTPFGLRVCAQHAVEVDPAHPADALPGLIARFSLPPGLWPVALGLPVERTYFTTRPIHIGGSDATPRVLLREALRSSSVPVDDMLVDVITSQPDHRTVASIVSCDRQYVQSLTEPLEKAGLQVERVEPIPAALLRLAGDHAGSFRRAKVACRVFLGARAMLAVLTARHQPILWRRALLPRGDEASAILAAVRSLVTTGEQSGIETRPEAVVVHGRADLSRLLDLAWLERELACAFEWLPSPHLCPELIARGLAESCFQDHTRTLDLARTIKARPTLRQMFPWRDTATHGLVLLSMLTFLGYQWTAAEELKATAAMRNAQSATASLSRQQLEQERADLSQRLAAVQDFVGSRVLWTNYHRTLASVLPDNIFLTSVHGDGELPKSKKNNTRVKRQLVIQGAVSIPQDGLIPHEIDRLLDTLRSHNVLAEDFPVIELAELKQFKRPQENDTLAMFTVICLPEGAKKTQ